MRETMEMTMRWMGMTMRWMGMTMRWMGIQWFVRNGIEQNKCDRVVFDE